MDTRTYKQFGTFTVAISGAVALLIAMALIHLIRSSGSGILSLLIVLIILIICLLLFYQLTITVDETKVAFKMGIGIIGKSFRISDIKSCRSVRNSFIMGVGIHWIGNGWLYNVSGFKAIELKFNNKKSVVRIGTNTPEEISELIQSMIGKNEVYESPQADIGRRMNPYRLILLIVALCIVGLIFYENRENECKIENNSFIIHGMYGVTIPLNKIAGIDTITNLPQIVTKISGYDDFRTKRGTFELANQGEVRLFIKTGHSPYLRIWVKNGVPVYLNFRKRQKTIEEYRELLKSFEKQN